MYFMYLYKSQFTAQNDYGGLHDVGHGLETYKEVSRAPTSKGTNSSSSVGSMVAQPLLVANY
jgi:hypothetical protein